MDIENNADLERALRETGYSKGAISEIVKWYSKSSLIEHTDKFVLTLGMHATAKF